MSKRPEDACKHIGIDDSKSKPKRVLETVVDEIDLQMDEETVKRSEERRVGKECGS